jgi:hypothetical protein
MKKAASLQLLNLYGKDEEDVTELSHSQEEIPSVDNVEATSAGFSIVDYEHDDDEHDDQYTTVDGNVGRAVINPIIVQVQKESSKPSTPEQNEPVQLPNTPPAFVPSQTVTQASPPLHAQSTNPNFSGLYPSPSPARSDLYLPPEPTGSCDARVQAKIKKFHEMKVAGTSINDNLRKSKAFRNPDILEKLVLYCNINEIGSNYPPHLFDPFIFKEEDFYDAIAQEQRRLEEKREQERANRTQIDFTRAETQTFPSRPTVHIVDGKRPAAPKDGDGEKEAKGTTSKKSKWDCMDATAGVKPGAPAIACISAPPSGNAYAEYVKQRKKREAEVTKTQLESHKKLKQ